MAKKEGPVGKPGMFTGRTVHTHSKWLGWQERQVSNEEACSPEVRAEEAAYKRSVRAGIRRHNRRVFGE